MDAVRLAAKILREGVVPDDGEDDWTLGTSVARVDVEEKYLEQENIRMTIVWKVCYMVLH